MHKNRMFYALIFIDNYIITCIDYMLSMINCYLLSFWLANARAHNEPLRALIFLSRNLNQT